MCRWLAYFGDPIRPEELLYEPRRSLIEQSRRSGPVVAVRYASGPEVNTLFVSTSVHDLRLLLPAEERFRHFSDEARVVVSEPLIDLPGLWHEIPPSTALIVRDGPDSEDVPFVPCPP